MADGGWVSTHEDITERRRAEIKIAHMARHDIRTDLPNRVLFHERLSQALAGIHRGEQLALSTSISTISKASTTRSDITSATSS